MRAKSSTSSSTWSGQRRRRRAVHVKMRRDGPATAASIISLPPVTRTFKALASRHRRRRVRAALAAAHHQCKQAGAPEEEELVKGAHRCRPRHHRPYRGDATTWPTAGEIPRHGRQLHMVLAEKAAWAASSISATFRIRASGEPDSRHSASKRLETCAARRNLKW